MQNSGLIGRGGRGIMTVIWPSALLRFAVALSVQSKICLIEIPDTMGCRVRMDVVLINFVGV